MQFSIQSFKTKVNLENPRALVLYKYITHQNKLYHGWGRGAFSKLSLSCQHSIQFCCPFFCCICS